MSMKPFPRALVLCLAAGALAAPARADEAPESTHPFEHVRQFGGGVVVQADGNGVFADTFPTTVEGEAVRYVMVIQNGCESEPGAGGSCPSPVRSLTVTLNDDVVFQSEELFRLERVQVPLNDVGGGDNRIVLAARGNPGSGAHVT